MRRSPLAARWRVPSRLELVEIRADVSAFAAPKRRAVAAHATQVAEWQVHLSDERTKMLSTEYFHVARGTKPPGDDPLA